MDAILEELVKIFGKPILVVAGLLPVVFVIVRYYLQHKSMRESIKEHSKAIADLTTSQNLAKIEAQELAAKEREYLITQLQHVQDKVTKELAEVKKDFGIAIAAIKTSTNITQKRIDDLFTSLVTTGSKVGQND
ncbi:MAG: hypothetical protein Tp152SUR00d2C52646391_83 [Prokaryotic dsDNA virus sp.]|nr:MAG: hypothetical protein Tp152SUR00d2C52646391_83 [Prokaryotic dsDNA virus sp.]|tara:strand:- start:5155 stop:5556 length:402 start_codon:yes stop_codon:yes gene_type:complete